MYIYNFVISPKEVKVDGKVVEFTSNGGDDDVTILIDSLWRV